MPPININSNPLIPSISQKREMHFYLKMLLHTNGSLPSLPGLSSFWHQSINEKVKLLKEELKETSFD